MRIPADAIIADDKLTRYLLVHRPFDDKSGFLAQAGFTVYNWAVLRQAIRGLADSSEGLKLGGMSMECFSEMSRWFTGPAGVLGVKLIWIRCAIDGRFHFVTLVPWKE